jgi:hypothetical protein
LRSSITRKGWLRGKFEKHCTFFMKIYEKIRGI